MYINSNRVKLPEFIFEWYLKNHKSLNNFLKEKLDNVEDVDSVIIQVYIANAFPNF